MVNAPEEVDAWTHGEMLRPSKRVLTDLVSVLQAVARHPWRFPPRRVQTLQLCCAHQVRQAANHTHAGCVYVIFNAGCEEDARFGDETNRGFWDDAVEGRVQCGD